MAIAPDLPRRLCIRIGLAGLAHPVAAPGRARAQVRPGTTRSAGPLNGALLLVGGGEIGPEIAAEVRRLDGGAGARWVVVPTAAEDGNVDASGRSDFASRLGRPFAVLHTRDRTVADTPAFIAPLRDATAVWFEGGRQTRLVDAYGGTETEWALRGVLERGGLIAGTSAGATVQGSYLVRGRRGGINAASGRERAFAYFRNVAVDQHVDACRAHEGPGARRCAAFHAFPPRSGWRVADGSPQQRLGHDDGETCA